MKGVSLEPGSARDVPGMYRAVLFAGAEGLSRGRPWTEALAELATSRHTSTQPVRAQARAAPEVQVSPELAINRRG